jgi:hypothetical protein
MVKGERVPGQPRRKAHLRYRHFHEKVYFVKPDLAGFSIDSACCAETGNQHR